MSGRFLTKLGADKRAALELGVRRVLDSLPKVSGDGAQVYMSNSCSQTIDRAEGIAKQMRDEFVSTEHLFLSIIEKPEPTQIADLFRSLQIKPPAG